MTKFQDMTYVRPQLADIEAACKTLISRFKQAQSFTEQDALMEEMNDLMNKIETQQQLVYIRHSIDTNDAFYKQEKDYFDDASPQMEEHLNAFDNTVMASPFRAELEEKWGKQLFRLTELKLKTFHPDVIPDLQKENKLTTEYAQLIASAKIQFKGEERTLSQLTPFEQDKDRTVRKEAARAKTDFMSAHEEQLDRIYDDLVKVRTSIAQKLGFENFVELGYARMSRTDYDASMVDAFRKQVREHIVPLVTALKQRQEKRIGVDTLRYYDTSFQFTSGNPTPKGDPEWILQTGEKMYNELSPETTEFFQFMRSNELLDVLSRKGKEGGGYCTYINDYQSPFIFANFNGTSGDVDVLTHEVGHAFQVYESRALNVPQYNFPTSESAEIHSMSMEFFAWPWMEDFFKEDTEKYKFDHLASALTFIPYGVAVDEFQHIIYSQPELTPQQRKDAWRKLESTYLPHVNYEGNDYLENGALWQRQLHIYEVPFYYIDYTLAQICALQFWKRMNDNREQAWADYLALCKLGGSRSFLELVSSANLASPFEDGCVSSVIQDIQTWLDRVDDQAL
ncbi:M3 family oligoendopeptidase [Aureibacillus halotolerans]|uniref:M3 family oligoendopeptidase n=1 Tax=Aureibacillus halotolerans TaxID=1508390 RepID=UPI00105FD39F|nr:M3 family oligoendopeptidase [Aureibacillus halotolerans]